MEYDYYTLYTDIHLSDKVKNFSENHHNSQWPSEIYQNILELRVQGFKLTVHSQVYYLQHKVSMKHQQRYKNQIESAKLLFKENEKDQQTMQFSIENFRGLVTNANTSIIALAAESKKLEINAIFGTSSTGCELFAVLQNKARPEFRSLIFSLKSHF